MFEPYFNVAMLAAESQRVIALRLWKLSWGGSAAVAESYHMVAEKMESASYAATRLMFGASPDSVIDDYRRTVQANVQRLSA